MGTESFFIECISEDSHVEHRLEVKTYFGSESKTEADFLLFLKLRGYKAKNARSFRGRYIINRELILDVLSSGTYFQGFALEGCFSDYEKNIALASGIIQSIDSDFLPLCLKRPDGVYVRATQENADLCKNYIDQRHMIFQKNYPCSFKSLPGRDFFRKYRLRQLFKKNL